MSCSILLPLLIASLGHAEPTIRVAAEPALPLPNLLRNANFEEGADGAPSDWRFNTARPDVFDQAWAEGGYAGSRSVRVTASSSEMSGYWGQTIEVTPGTYVFKGYFRLAAGRILIYAQGASRDVEPAVEVNSRFYAGTVRGHWLVPVFIPIEALTGPDEATYQPFRMAFDVPEGLTHVTLNLGMYFEAGEAWFDDLWFGPAEADLAITVDPDGAEVERLIVHSDIERKPVYISPEGESPPLELTLDDVAADAVYTVTLKLADGSTIASTYPNGGGE